jgi:hypothetical protein
VIDTVRLSLMHIVFLFMLTPLVCMSKINGGRIARRVKVAKIFVKRNVNERPIS